MATKHRAIGNADRAYRDEAKMAVESARRIAQRLLNPGRPMTETEKSVWLRDLQIEHLTAINALNLLGREEG